jgi:sortase (surface protein transpeptidase)
MRAPPPLRLAIPAIGVHTRLVRLGLTPQGTLQVPGNTAEAGWYTGGPRPGQLGPAVIAGHIDSYNGPAVFYQLRLLRPGDLVYVRRVGGSRVVFRVYAERKFAKERFPTSLVYGGTPDAELRLITCGGSFDYATGSYLSNVVVFGSEVRVTHPRHWRHRRRAHPAGRSE